MTFETVQKDDDTDKESFEDMPLITVLLTNLGFYILMIAGFISQLFVKQKFETEKNRDVSVLEALMLRSWRVVFLNRNAFFP